MDLDPATRDHVRSDLHSYLSTVPRDELVGVSCIADGADSIFAEVVLELGGRLQVVLPSQDYREKKVAPYFRDLFDRLISKAAEVSVIAETANRAAYEAANARVLELADVLLAVWDGVPAQTTGGTAATVHQAEALGIRVVRFWRDGFVRGSSATLR